MIRRPPRSTLDRSSAASDVYKRQREDGVDEDESSHAHGDDLNITRGKGGAQGEGEVAVSYTHLRAHETVLELVCRLLLEKNNVTRVDTNLTNHYANVYIVHLTSRQQIAKDTNAHK